MARRKPNAAQPSLFGANVEAKPARPQRPNPLAPWFDAIAAIVGKTAVGAARSRVGRIAKNMRDAGLTPDRLADLPDVIRRYASWRSTLDLNTVQACWSWLIDPPKTVGGGEVMAAVQAIQRNGGEPPF